MPSKRVACKGGGKATASSAKNYLGRAGAWTPVPPGTLVVEETYDQIVVNGAKALKKVSYTFTFSFTDGANPVSATLPVELVPGTTVARDGGASLLLDGQNTGVLKNEGNVVKVESSRPLGTA